MSLGKTRTVTVNSVAATAIAAAVYSSELTVNEDPSVANWPTTDYLVSKPTSADAQRRIPAGQAYTFRRNAGVFVPGEVVGYVQTVSGSTTFAVDEAG